MFFLVLGGKGPRHSFCNVSTWTRFFCFFFFFDSTDESTSIAKKVVTIVRQSSILRSRKANCRRLRPESWRILKTAACDLRGFAVKQFAVDLEFRYSYMMIYVVFRAGPGQLCQFCMMTLSVFQTILNICLSYVNRYFRILAKKCFPLEYLQNLHATKTFFKWNNCCTHRKRFLIDIPLVSSLCKKVVECFQSRRHVKRLKSVRRIESRIRWRWKCSLTLFGNSVSFSTDMLVYRSGRQVNFPWFLNIKRCLHTSILIWRADFAVLYWNEWPQRVFFQQKQILKGVYGILWICHEFQTKVKFLFGK